MEPLQRHSNKQRVEPHAPGAKPTDEVVETKGGGEVEAVRKPQGKAGEIIASPESAKEAEARAKAAGNPKGAVGEAPKKSEASEIRHLYGIHGVLPRAEQRVVHWVVELHKLLVAVADANDPVARATQEDVRVGFFMPEGILRLYRDAYGKSLEEGRGDLKDLEDRLGKYGHASDMVVKAKKLEGLDADAKEYLQERLDKQKHKVGEDLKEWLPNDEGVSPKLESVVANITAVEWKLPDPKTIVEAICAQYDKIHDSDYDMRDLQKGLHELRRQLRWPPMYGMALRGAVVLTDERVPDPALADLVNDPVAKSPFGQLPTSDQEAHPLTIARTLFLRQTQLIGELGKLKDTGELIEAVAEALAATQKHLDADEATKRAAEIVTGDRHAMKKIHQAADVLYAEIKELAVKLRDDVASNLEPSRLAAAR